MNLNRLLLRKGKPYVGPVCWAHPDLYKDVKKPGFYATKTMPGERNDRLMFGGTAGLALPARRLSQAPNCGQPPGGGCSFRRCPVMHW